MLNKLSKLAIVTSLLITQQVFAADAVKINKASAKQLKAYDAYFDENHKRHIREVSDLVAIPTLAMVKEHAKDLTKAAGIAISDESVVRMVDLGKVGDDFFMLRVGVGFEGEKVKGADRELKDRFGILAYSIAGLKALKETKVANYGLTLDGEEIEVEAFNCMVDNCGNFGVSGFTLARDISVSDGLLDVIVIRDKRFRSSLSTVESIAGKPPDPESFHHWQARQITIEADPPQLVHLDGEMWGETPVTANVLPGVLPILTPGG